MKKKYSRIKEDLKCKGDEAGCSNKRVNQVSLIEKVTFNQSWRRRGGGGGKSIPSMPTQQPAQNPKEEVQPVFSRKRKEATVGRAV